ncbi:serpin B6-like [Rhinophrynus dorsalis]
MCTEHKTFPRLKIIGCKEERISHSFTMEAVCTANNQFTVDLVKHISSAENSLISPFSILTTMAMLWIGAGGKTASQMKKALHLGNMEDTNSGFKALLTLLNKNDDYILNSANRIYFDNNFDIIQAYIEACKLWYHSEPQKVDFMNNPDGSRKLINDWVEQNTGGKIQNLLPSGSVDSLTRLIAVNTLYFKGNWSKRFPKHNTKKASFTLINNEKVNVEMMSTDGSFNTRRIHHEKVSILELPYGQSQEMSMFIILPDKASDITNIVKNFSYKKLSDWTNSGKLTNTAMSVSLPRFQLQQGLSVKEVLTKLGILDAFDQSKANFSRIAKVSLHVSDVVHKTFMKVNEDGTEAAAATAAVVETTSVIIPTMSFIVDRSFLFTIQNKKSNCVLFIGKCLTP